MSNLSCVLFCQMRLKPASALAPSAGDDVRDDVGGAQAAGLRGILVQTGKWGPAACCLPFLA